MKRRLQIFIALAFLYASSCDFIYAKQLSLNSNAISVINEGKNLQIMIEEADKLYWQDQYKEALDLYKQIAAAISIENKASYLHWLACAADCNCRLNDYLHALATYEEILKNEKSRYGAESVNIVETMINLAACNYYLKKYDKAAFYSQKSINLLEKAGSTDAFILAKIHLGFAEILYHQSKYHDAAKQYLIAIKYYDKLYTLSREDIIEPLMVALEGLGASYYHTEQYPLAKSQYERLANLQRTTLGDEDVRYGWSLLTISNIETSLGHQEISQSLFEKSVWIFRNANKNRLMAEYEGQGKLTPELAKRIELYTYGNNDQNKARSGDNLLKSSNESQALLQCSTNDRSLVKPGPWKLVTTAEIDPAGWVWIDPTKPLRGIIVCVHGLGLNARSYDSFAKEIVQAGYTVISFHLRGFSSYLWSKARDKVNFEQCLYDLTTVLKVIERDHNDLPVFILGESMGGAIALQLTALHPELISGLICSVPAGNRYKAPSTDLNVALHFVKGINTPFDIGTKIVGQATKQENLRKEWSSDPFNRLALSPKELIQFAAFMSKNKAAANKIKNTPVIVFQGVQDKLIKAKGTLEIYNAISSLDKDLVMVGSSEHLIFENTKCPESVVLGLTGWMQTHNQKPSLLSIK